MKFETLLDKAREEMNAKEDYDYQLAMKCSDLQQTRDEMAAALRSGKMALFTELTKKSTAQEAALKQLSENEPKLTNTADGIIAAWNKHIETHNKEFAEKLDAFRAARHALCEMYMELIEMQRTALVLRQQTSKIIGAYDPTNPGLLSQRMPSGEYLFPEKAYADFGLDAPAALEKNSGDVVIKCNNVPATPEAAYFIARGELPKEMLGGLTSIQQNFHPCSKLDLVNSGRYRLDLV